MKVAMRWLFCMMALGAIVSCSDAGGPATQGAAQPGLGGQPANGQVQLRQQWYSTHLTGAALLQQLQQETSSHGQG
jgi:hypothetical protein